MARMDRAFGREAFGGDAAGYDAARPGYPEAVFELLSERCGLVPEAAVFEVGPGTGVATRPLLERGAKPLVAVEPDGRMAQFLRRRIPDPALQIVVAPFETADLGRADFDLGLSATAFHWLDEDVALPKVAALLRPGGWWAMMWNVFGFPGAADPFHEATKSMMKAGPRGVSPGVGDVWYPLDATARLAALARTGAFEAAEHRVIRWPLILDADQVVALYASFSVVIARADRDEVLAKLGRIARDEFGGRVTRNMTTSLYIARRV